MNQQLYWLTQPIDNRRQDEPTTLWANHRLEVDKQQVIITHVDTKINLPTYQVITASSSYQVYHTLPTSHQVILLPQQVQNTVSFANITTVLPKIQK